MKRYICFAIALLISTSISAQVVGGGPVIGGGGSGGTGTIGGTLGATDNAICRADGTGTLTAQGSPLTLSDVSGVTTTLATITPAATTGATVAGQALAITASPAVASTDTAGAAAGGSVTITAGAAARFTSGNANGGDINLVPGAGIGTGTVGTVRVGSGTASLPSIGISGNTDTGFGYHQSHLGPMLVRDGVIGLFQDAYEITVPIPLWGSGSVIFGFRGSLSSMNGSVASPQSVGVNDQGGILRVLTNEGASAMRSATLSAAAAGDVYTFTVQDADGIRIVANAGDTIRVIDKVTAAAGYIESTTIGSSVQLIALNATEFLAISINGTWTDGTFTFDNTSLTTP